MAISNPAPANARDTVAPIAPDDKLELRWDETFHIRT